MIHEWSILAILIAVIVIAGGVAVMYIILRKLGITVPDWIVQIFWVLVAVFVGVFALKLLWSMW
jgi:hypothetical protein